MKTVFLAFLLLNFCQPQAATLQLSGVVAEKTVVQPHHHHHHHWHHRHHRHHHHYAIHPRKNCRVYWAPVKKHHAPKWQQVSKPLKVKSSCHVKVTAL